MCLEGFGDEVEGVAVLLAAGFDEVAAGVALGAEREFVPDVGVAERLFRAVVVRFDSGDVGERPELVESFEQAIAQRDRRRVTAPLPVFQGAIERPSNGLFNLPSQAYRDGGVRRDSDATVRISPAGGSSGGCR